MAVSSVLPVPMMVLGFIAFRFQIRQHFDITGQVSLVLFHNLCLGFNLRNNIVFRR